MRVADAMTSDVQITTPDQSIVEAAQMMADCDCGALLVGENDQLVGMITDRDIVVRALALGKAGETKIREIMSKEVKYCFEDDEVSDVARNMGDLQVRRLAVLNEDKRLVGILALGDISNPEEVPSAAQALSDISKPSSEQNDPQRSH